MTTLGTLEKIALREAWETEAQHFTPWLAQEENIEILGDALGMDLEVQAVEKNVGLFRADIVCADLSDETNVLIENQLGRTDHTHLGQILTYAAGTDAATVVWISARFTDEHRAALDWLNEHTHDNIQFFGVQIELWKIGKSEPAPRFNIVSKPNNWTRTIARNSGAGRPMTEMRERQLKYWTELMKLLETELPAITVRMPRARSWATYSIGRTGFHLATATSTFDNSLKASLVVRREDGAKCFEALQLDKIKIEQELGEPLVWDEKPDRIARRVDINFSDADPSDEADWPRQHAWFAEKLRQLDAVFRPRVTALSLDSAA